MPNSSLGILGGHPASICLGIQSQGNCHASACSGIHQPGVQGGQPASTCLGIWSSKSCHASICLGIHQSRDPRRSTHLNVPRDPVLGRSTCFNLAGDSISKRLSRLSLPGDPPPDLGMPGSQVATVLGRIGFEKTHP